MGFIPYDWDTSFMEYKWEDLATVLNKVKTLFLNKMLLIHLKTIKVPLFQTPP